MIEELFFKTSLWLRYAAIAWFVIILLTGLSLIASCWLAIFNIIPFIFTIWWLFVFTLVIILLGPILAAAAKSFDKNIDKDTNKK